MADPYAAYEVTRIRDFNPDTGQSMVIIFAGDIEQMEAIAAYYQQAGLGAPIGYGYKTTIQETANGIFLTVRIPDDILYTEKWNLATEIIQIPIWRDKTTRDYCVGTIKELDLTDDPTGQKLRTLMWRIGLISRGSMNISAGSMASNVFDNTAPPAGASDLGGMTKPELKLMLQMVREGAYMDWKRPVLKRQRYIPSINLAVRTTLVGRALLYSLDGIASAFGIPDDNYNQAVTAYDSLPTAEANTMWAWKMGRNDSEGVVGAAKVSECLEFAFGMWSTITNTFIE